MRGMAMNWQNVSKVGMPKRNGLFLIRDISGSMLTTKHPQTHEDRATHWCEITPSCCQCGEVDGVDYCMKDGCVPF